MDKTVDKLPFPNIKKKLSFPEKQKKKQKGTKIHYLDSLLDKKFLNNYFEEKNK